MNMNQQEAETYIRQTLLTNGEVFLGNGDTLTSVDMAWNVAEKLDEEQLVQLLDALLRSDVDPLARLKVETFRAKTKEQISASMAAGYANAVVAAHNAVRAA